MSFHHKPLRSYVNTGFILIQLHQTMTLTQWLPNMGLKFNLESSDESMLNKTLAECKLAPETRK